MGAELAARLKGHVEALAGSIGERNVWRAHALAARYVREQWEAQGHEVVYRYPHYHSPQDTPEKLNYPEMARVVFGLGKAIGVLAGAPALRV